MEANVCEIIIDFLNVAIHQILFLRDIYPEEVFASAKQYGVPVKMSRHPELNHYIAESLILTRDWITKVIKATFTLRKFIKTHYKKG